MTYFKGLVVLQYGCLMKMSFHHPYPPPELDMGICYGCGLGMRHMFEAGTTPIIPLIPVPPNTENESSSSKYDLL